MMIWKSVFATSIIAQIARPNRSSSVHVAQFGGVMETAHVFRVNSLARTTDGSDAYIIHLPPHVRVITPCDV